MLDERKTKGQLITELRELRQRLIIFEQEQKKLKLSITERKRAENIMHARLRLLKFAESHSLEEFTQATLDESEALTASTIGFYHLVEADQRTLSLQTWSTNTLQHMCTAEGKGQHYDVAEAGVWVDCVHQRRPVIHNCYDALPYRKGMPPGHAPVVRELIVPIFRANKIVAIIGVGNKPSDYDDWDVEAVSLLGDLSWDITERKRAEEALRESEERFRIAAETTNDLIYEWDLKQNLQWSDRIDEMLGYDPAEFSRTLDGWMESVHPEDIDHVKASIKTHLEGLVPYIEEYRIRRKDGVYRWWTARGDTSMSPDGTSVRWIGTVTDITERKRAEESLRKRTAELEFANREMESFSYSVSHDLKAPVRAIEGFSRMLMAEHADKLDAEALRLLQVITTNTKLMHHLIDDLLALSRLGRLQIRKSVINLTAITNKVFEKLRSQAPERDLQLTLGDLPPGLGDQSLLYQVMENLLANAVKFTKSRETAVIEVGGRTEGKENIYYVKDNGAGFDGRYVDNLFRPFQRLHGGEEYEGTGVGLAIVQRIIQRHGGRVWAEGRVGEGATFYFTLPNNED